MTWEVVDFTEEGTEFGPFLHGYWLIDYQNFGWQPHEYTRRVAAYIHEVLTYCRETFGEEKGLWVYSPEYETFAFRHERDRLVFKMRWC